jgi:hypothetical protein
MRKISVVSCLIALTAMMLLPIASQVNAASVNQPTWSQSGGPIPPPPDPW